MSDTASIRHHGATPPPPVDPNVRIPDSVKRAAALAESFYNKAPAADAPPPPALMLTPPAPPLMLRLRPPLMLRLRPLRMLHPLRLLMLRLRPPLLLLLRLTTIYLRINGSIAIGL